MRRTDEGQGVLMVKPRSKKDMSEVAKYARGVAKKAKCLDGHRLDAMQFLEALDARLDSFKLHIAQPDEFPSPSHEGLTRPNGEILIREDVYLHACDGVGRARFTVIHELMHWMLHRNEFAFARSSADVKPFRNPEWQANTGASLTLMSMKAVRYVDADPEDLVDLCGVSYTAATARCDIFRQHSL